MTLWPLIVKMRFSILSKETMSFDSIISEIERGFMYLQVNTYHDFQRLYEVTICDLKSSRWRTARIGLPTSRTLKDGSNFRRHLLEGIECEFIAGRVAKNKSVATLVKKGIEFFPNIRIGMIDGRAKHWMTR